MPLLPSIEPNLGLRLERCDAVRLGVGATVLYYQGIAAACAERSIVPRLTVAHANAPTALAFGTLKFTIGGNLFGALDAFDIVRPGDDEVDEIHRIYLALATKGQISTDDEARLRELAHTLCRRDRIEAIVLAGTDLNLVFNEANAGFPAVDCAAAHIDAIVEQMMA